MVRGKVTLLLAALAFCCLREAAADEDYSKELYCRECGEYGGPVKIFMVGLYRWLCSCDIGHERAACYTPLFTHWIVYTCGRLFGKKGFVGPVSHGLSAVMKRFSGHRQLGQHWSKYRDDFYKCVSPMGYHFDH